MEDPTSDPWMQGQHANHCATAAPYLQIFNVKIKWITDFNIRFAIIHVFSSMNSFQ